LRQNTVGQVREFNKGLIAATACEIFDAISDRKLFPYPSKDKSDWILDFKVINEQSIILLTDLKVCLLTVANV
jgi:hypothetical protein